MLDPKTTEILQRQYTVAVLCADAFIGALFVYGFLAYWFSRTDAVLFNFTASDLKLLRPVLYAIGLMSFFVAKPIGRLLLLSPLAEGSENRAEQCTSRLLSSLMITFALCEAPAIFGLVLSLAGCELRDFLVLAVPALAAMVFYFPRYMQWEEWVQSKLL